MENTHAEYLEWLALEGVEKEKSTEDGYNRALSKLQQIQIFEDRLVSFWFVIKFVFDCCYIMNAH